MKLTSAFLISLAYLTMNTAFAKTYCFVIIGEGSNYDPLYPVASHLLRNAPLKGTCLNFKTWNELSIYFDRNQSSYSVEDQFFIAQAVHGSTGGRAFDREGTVTPEQINNSTTVEQLGGTSPQEIVGVLKTMASRRYVAFHDMSCHGGSLLTRYVQQMDAAASVDESQSRLCMVTDSIQGMVTTVRDLTRSPYVDLSGLSMTDVFRTNVEVVQGVKDPVVMGLISAAKMSILPGYTGNPSVWEGEQWPMAIYHTRVNRSWTGAYQTCKFELDYGKKPIPIWGLDWSVEQIYRTLDTSDPEALNNCSITPHKASVESLELPMDTLTQAQQLRRKACDEFKL